MKRFDGFPAKMEFTPLPNVFFSALLPQITDIAELKVTLYIIASLYRKKGYPRFVTFGELIGNKGLMSGLKEIDGLPEDILRTALKTAVERGTLLNLPVEKEGTSENIYFLNDDAGRQAVDRIESGDLELSGLKTVRQEYLETEEQPDIFTLYERNIGMLTPMVADELREAEKLYPKEWIADAFKEAVLYNKRNIKYILKILENWVAEGRSDGTHRRHPKKTDPDRFIKGKYGHMVRR
jgi:DNA replication protein